MVYKWRERKLLGVSDQLSIGQYPYDSRLRVCEGGGEFPLLVLNARRRGRGCASVFVAGFFVCGLFIASSPPVSLFVLGDGGDGHGSCELSLGIFVSLHTRQ